MKEALLALQSKEVRDEHAFWLLMEIIQLGKGNHRYDHLLDELKIALKYSPTARLVALNMTDGVTSGKR